MTDPIEILPAIIPHDASAFSEVLSRASFAPWIHLDVEDGVFTEHFSWPYEKASELSAAPLMLPAIAIEAHLMVQDARAVGDLFLAAGARRIIAHIESFKNAEEARMVLSEWRAQGAEVGLAILIETPLAALEGAGEECDCIQVMSIAKIGAHGAPFDPRAIGRVGEVHQKYPHAVVSVDGGVGEGNIAELARIGARRFVAGSALFGPTDSTAAYQSLKLTAERALS